MHKCSLLRCITSKVGPCTMPAKANHLLLRHLPVHLVCFHLRFLHQQSRKSCVGARESRMCCCRNGSSHTSRPHALSCAGEQTERSNLQLAVGQTDGS